MQLGKMSTETVEKLNFNLSARFYTKNWKRTPPPKKIGGGKEYFEEIRKKILELL